MRRIGSPEEAVNADIIKPGSTIYASGNAATPQVLLEQLGDDLTIKSVDIMAILPLGDRIKRLFSEERCRKLTHRVIFNSANTREAVNNGWAYYQPMHLSEVPKHVRQHRRPNVAMISVAGPDNGGNYSLGTTIEAVLDAVITVKEEGGVVIAERNAQMPFVLGATVPADTIDYLIDVDYPLPISPVEAPDDIARRIADIIASLYIKDGRGKQPGSTLQYGIGEVPEAVTAAIFERGYGDLAIHTELFASAMMKLVQKGVVTNRWKRHLNFAVSSIFLAEDQAGYDWMHYNSSIQGRPCSYTNSVFKIAEQPNMVTINGAIGVDLHGNIWADSLDARKIYSGVGGQADFIRGAQYSDGGVAIIAMKATTTDGKSKIVDRCPAGITTTAIAADQVILVTEHGAFDPRGLSLGERAWGIAQLAAPLYREKLLRMIIDHPAYHKPDVIEADRAMGFTSYDEAIRRG